MTDREAPEAPERLYVKSFSGYAREWIGIETAENDFQTPYIRLDLHEARVRELEERAGVGAPRRKGDGNA